ncbi:tRNA preQ1(34) S-adenosylmethionine ribosyltransferase-isomerase QueA [bacterium]|nr:tRNA preQ1(34) S-adenosylmethionine ribosyltransferase-isomerase QueA [FCB group bacterium]MBL7190319.1 tRNA preQ1(34) S-adenosylmethionine ribosyltransferase-isomerase QueA [bacterium]
MRLSDFKYNVPQRLIAQEPLEKRDASRLMMVNRKTGQIEHRKFYEISDYFNPGDALVVNITKVFPARLKGYKEKTDADIEVLLLRELNDSLWEVLVKPARKVRTGNTITVADDIVCEVVDNTTSGGRVVRFLYDGDFHKVIMEHGLPPLPPYIRREPTLKDRERYQTVYATITGAVAAPTAGLHFTPELMVKLEEKGVQIIPVLLHISLGTFRPVTVEDLTRHRMDSEYYEMTPQSAHAVNDVIGKGGKICAVGTTVVRVLETLANFLGGVKPGQGWTDKFIYPPYKFKVVDRLITNFHLPCSTLLMLVSAFAGRELVLKSYRKAAKENYRFYSYGDAQMYL